MLNFKQKLYSIEKVSKDFEFPSKVYRDFGTTENTAHKICQGTALLLHLSSNLDT